MSIRLTGSKAALAVAALTLVAGAAAQSSGPRKPAPPDATRSSASAQQSPHAHIVIFREAPLATYQGERPGLAAPPRHASGKRKGKIDVHSGPAKAYVNDLRNRQRNHENSLARTLGRPLQVNLRMQHAVNAVVTVLSPAEAAQVKRDPNVLLVEGYREYALDTDAGPLLIGAPTVWNSGSGLPPGLRTDESGPAKGEGIVFGILDSGINFGSPSFAAIDGLGYQHTNPLGTGNYLGTCTAGQVDDGRCNDKLIGGYDFVCGAPAFQCGRPNIREEPGFGDTSGHGSHTASTAAGNHRDTTFRGAAVQLSGVAPRGNIIAYDICYTNTATGQGLCPNVSAVAAVNQAVADGVVDVINYSIGGGAAPWNEAVSLTFLNASDAGIYIAASAGNSGPGAGTLGHNEPWTASTAAATHNRQGFEFFFSVTGPSPVPPALTTILLRPGSGGVAHTSAIPGTTPLVVSPTFNAANDGCVAFPAGTFQNAIAVITRGSCSFSTKANSAAAAGAIAIVIANNQAGLITPSVPGTTIPAFMVFQDDGIAIRDFAAGKSNATAGIGYPALVIPGTPDVLASFSSRGPAPFDLLKPDLTAPGVNILAAYAGSTITGFAQLIDMISGTSMASPHQAGAAGLIRQLHPSWSVPEIKSALALTATQGVLLQDGVTPANAFASGSGRVQVDLAARAGLVMHETTANYLAANPNAGGDPATLNQPSMARGDCSSSCTFTRVFRSTRKNSQAFLVSLEGLGGSVSLGKINVKASGTQTLQVTIDGSQLPANGLWQFGALVLTPEKPGANSSPTLRLPIAVKVPAPVIPLLNLTGLSGAAGSDQFYQVTVPTGASSLIVRTSGGTGDLDLYVRQGQAPTDTAFNCRPFLDGNNETCTIVSPAAGVWHIRLNAFTAFSGATLTAGYTN
ncbi:MAG: S8 family serine peptidase [Pseudomonadota bacterium]|nr:S8 family serine peptidase [Pseudomonadota bacterium]